MGSVGSRDETDLVEFSDWEERDRREAAQPRPDLKDTWSCEELVKVEVMLWGLSGMNES